MSDEAIQLTNNDASSFKSYAVHQGYWNDPYIKYFSPIASSSNLHSHVPPQYVNEHKPPEMSRGYFARISSMRTTVLKFLEYYRQPTGLAACQIVNLGAGYDTMFFNLSDSNNLPRKYVEVDFLRVVTSKIRLIKSKKVLAEKVCPILQTKANDLVLTDVSSSTEETKPGLFKLPTSTVNSSLISIAPGKDLITENYCLVSVDLRNIEELGKKLNECKLDRSLPTLFITECVLVYMSTENSAQLLNHLNITYKQCCFLNYEMVNLSDKFGEIMLYNMQQRACKLAGSDVCASIQSQLTRFGEAGFDVIQCITLTDYYLNRLDKTERERIEALEFLDEKELLIQLLDHYCVCVAGNYSGANQILFE